MSLRSSLRDDFPSGWWHSIRWWLSCSLDVFGLIFICTLTVCHVRSAHRALVHREKPAKLAALPAERYLSALVINLVILGWVLLALFGRFGWQPPFALELLVIMLELGNIAVAGTVMVVITRSRLQHVMQWSMLDYIACHAPPPSRPPNTPEEYEAQFLHGLLDEDFESR